MVFDIYGRYRLKIIRKNDCWNIYRIDNGKQRREEGLIIPSELNETEILTYLDDMLHEVATTTNNEIHRID